MNVIVAIIEATTFIPTADVLVLIYMYMYASAFINALYLRHLNFFEYDIDS